MAIIIIALIAIPLILMTIGLCAKNKACLNAAKWLGIINAVLLIAVLVVTAVLATKMLNFAF